jgi:hypothetical protein
MMTAIANSPPDPILAINVFRERCETRAILVEACVFDLQQAVDGLQEAAEFYGLVDDIGQDAVQPMMAEAFAKVPIAGQLEADFSALADDLETITWPRLVASRSPIKAAEFLIKQNDAKRLREWLAKHTRAERLALKHHFMRRQQRVTRTTKTSAA